MGIMMRFPRVYVPPEYEPEILFFMQSESDQEAEVEMLMQPEGLGQAVKGYIYGGNSGSTRIADCEEFNDTSWTSKTDMPSPARDSLAGSEIIGNKVYAMTGTDGSPLQDCDGFNGSSWAAETNALTTRTTACAASVDTTVYLCAGTGDSQGCDSFDGSSWTAETDLPSPGRYGSCAATIGEYIYVCLGYSGVYMQDCDRYDGSSWSSMTDAPSPARDGACASELLSVNKMHVFGGSDDSSKYGDCDEFDGSSWTSKTDLPSPARWRAAAMAFVAGSAYEYVCGGRDTSGVLGDCDRFDGSSWTNKTDIPSPTRDYLAAGSI